MIPQGSKAHNRNSRLKSKTLGDSCDRFADLEESKHSGEDSHSADVSYCSLADGPATLHDDSDFDPSTNTTASLSGGVKKLIAKMTHDYKLTYREVSNSKLL